jgi:cell division protein FtsL
LFTIIVILEILYIYLENRFAVEDREYQEIQQQINRYADENAYLKEQILEAEALTTIWEKASQSGFVKAEYILLK